MDSWSPPPVEIFTQGNATKNSLFANIGTPFKRFLGVPLLMMLLMTLVGAGLVAVNRAQPSWVQFVENTIQPTFFQSSDTTGKVLELIISGLITQISIVTSMLLLVLQQVAGQMGNLVYDQFLNRHRNQFYLGYVLGAIALVILLRASISEDFNPVFGASIAIMLLFSVLALLVWFIYSAIHQMRPETIVHEIHDTTRRANQQHRKMLSRLRSESQSDAPIQVNLQVKRNGFLVNLNLDQIRSGLHGHNPDVEVIAKANLGDYVAYGEVLAQIKAYDRGEAIEVAKKLGQAYVFEHEMQIKNNPRYGLKQLETMAWTEGSTAKENPETVMMVLYVFRDLMMHWLLNDDLDAIEKEHDQIAMVYHDPVLPYLIDMIESLATISSESMQHETFAEVLDILSQTFPYQKLPLQKRSAKMIGRMLSAMGDHVLTGRLERSLTRLEEILQKHDPKTADQVISAHQALAASVGALYSRASRDNAHQRSAQHNAEN